MLFEAQITARTPSPSEAKAIYEALKVEASSQPTAHVKVEVFWKDCEVHLRLISTKRAAFRAALNSFFRLLSALEIVSTALGSS